MNVGPHLQIHQTMGRINIQTHNAELNITQRQAEQTIHQEPAKMRLQRIPAKLTIDQTEAWHNLDLKSPSTRIAEAAQEGKQAILEGIARRVRQGDELMHIERGGNPIQKQARENSQQHHSFDTGHTPSFQAVKIQNTPGSLRINWETHAPDMQVNIKKPEMDYRPGNVQISMMQYPSVDIDVAGLYIDQKG